MPAFVRSLRLWVLVAFIVAGTLGLAPVTLANHGGDHWTRLGADPLVKGGVWSRGELQKLVTSSKGQRAMRFARLNGAERAAITRQVRMGNFRSCTMRYGEVFPWMSFGRNGTAVDRNVMFLDSRYRRGAPAWCAQARVGNRIVMIKVPKLCGNITVPQRKVAPPRQKPKKPVTPKPPPFGPEVILQVGCSIPGINAFIEVRTSNGVQVVTIGCNLTQKVQVPAGTAIEVCIVGLPPGATVQIVSGGVFTSPNCIRVTGGVLVITIVVVVDVCSNIEGVQTSVPAGLVRDSAGSCVAPSAPPSPPPPPPGPPPPPPPPTPTPNQRPVADAGPNQELAMIGGSVSFCLNGSGSFDPDGGNIVSHVWTGTVNPPDVANPCVTVTESGVYSFTLTVTDDEGSTDTDQTTVSVIGEPSG